MPLSRQCLTGLSLIVLWAMLQAVHTKHVHRHNRDESFFKITDVNQVDQLDDAKNSPLYDPVHGVKMGIKDDTCDNGKDNVEIDWDVKSTTEIRCDRKDRINIEHEFIHFDEKKSLPSIHICLNHKIEYYTPLPLSGPHRPLWPKFGEYKYLPPQRWVHSLEHGVIALVYHPCMADTPILRELKSLLKGCLRKHVIFPYRHIPDEKPFALMAYSHAIWFGDVNLKSDDADILVAFMRRYALKALESRRTKDGQYSVGLIHPAEIVSDIKDSVICPGYWLPDE